MFSILFNLKSKDRSFFFYLLVSEKLGLNSTGGDAGSADALVPFILQCMDYVMTVNI